MTNTNEYKIRFRQRTGYMREIAGYGSWNEFQVVQGRKVISRHGTEDQAQKAINNLTGSPMTNTPDTDWHDLVKWLRECSNHRYTGGLDYYNITTSADTIERQAKEIERMRGALSEIDKNDPYHQSSAGVIARAALESR